MNYDVIIIGAGPAGYIAAARAGQLGMKTVLIEKKHIGGMCLNWGCIPIKSIIESARLLKKVKEAYAFGVSGINPDQVYLDWNVTKERAKRIVKKMTGGVDHLLQKSGVEVISGEARITGPDTVTVENRNLTALKIIIATGSYPRNADIPVDPSIIVSIDRLFDLEYIPQKMVIYGKGAVSIELAQFFNMAGSEVSMVMPDDDLMPGLDTFLLNYAVKTLNNAGIKMFSGRNITGYSDGKLWLGEESIPCDHLINASWRGAIIPPSDVNLNLTDNGFIATNDDFETSVPGITAIGDVNGRSYLAHVASAQGIWVINHLKGIRNAFHFKNYPYNIYSTPEVAQIGMTEQQLNDEGIGYKMSEYPLSANGKALAEGNTDGLIRILAENRFGQVMGVQIIADHATDMISEAAAFMQIEGTIYDVAQTIHAHPTISEIFMEAGFDAMDQVKS
jgi:dihydrolipoamide dehydrogenase